MKTNRKKQTFHAALLAACALTAVSFPAGNAWAADWNPSEYQITDTEDGKKIKITTSNTVGNDSTFRDENSTQYNLNDFKTVEINYIPTADAGGNRALGIYSAKYNFENTDFIVTVSGENGNSNNDGLHLTNWGPTFIVHDFTAIIKADSSDALNLSHDVGSDGAQQMGSIADIKGHLKAEIAHGNGIRANAPTTEKITNRLLVENGTEITINGGPVTQTVTLSDKQLDDLLGDKKVFGFIPARDQVKSMSATATYNPAAIYAGDDMYRFNCNLATVAKESGVLERFGDQAATVTNILNSIGDLAMGTETKGDGQIVLNGKTVLTLNGENNYGLFSGKNGHIQVKDDLVITSTGKNSYGVSAVNGNLIYGSGKLTATAKLDGYAAKLLGKDPISADLDINMDESQNIHGTSVTLGENTDVNITMKGNNSYALYAEGVDDTGEYNQNHISSAGEGIRKLDALGDVMAENSGLIDLKVTGTEQNYLEGDIKAYGTTENINVGATVTLDVRNALAGQGTIAAANGGTVNLSLGAYSHWTGRADDYQDAAADSQWGDSHAGKIDNAFGDDKEISSSGTVNLSLGENATWNVEGQSWVTKLSGADSIVFLAKNDENTGEAVGQALHVGTLEDSHTFVMNVAAENGDMLYVKNGTGAQQHLVINNREEVLEKMKVGKKIRFATVQDANGGFVDAPIDDTSILPSDSGSGAFGASTRIEGAGVYNVDFGIEYHDYGTEVEGDLGTDKTYNGSAFDENKPGDSYVDDNYGPAAGGTERQALFAENGGEETPSGSQNVYIVREANTMDDLSNGGKTIIAMSKVNYSNAVYMDRLNKRMGEARFLEGDDGLWVRLRHDRIGKSDAFRSQNTMFEIGYDWKDEAQKDGTHYRGFAFDYMRGTADYTNVLGEGDVRRAGLWYHDTWMGDKGHYTDYVVKYGRLSNDFDIYSELGEKIKGDYDNDVWSVSAEYGRKKDLGNDWYIEPQAQLQYAYVTDASYTTSQGTKVSLDSIDSLIGRAGFRLGRDTDEANTVYFKADILHEFLGGQSIRAMDSTGTLSTTYENEGTWYDVGFGFSHRMSEDKYMFLDVEKLFGNDNEDTYQVSIGLNMAF